MKVVYTPAALSDLDQILAYTNFHFPNLSIAVEQQIRAVVSRIAEHPESSPLVRERQGVRAAPLVRYPFKVFYRVRSDTIEILHIHHAARQLWTE